MLSIKSDVEGLQQQNIISLHYSSLGQVRPRQHQMNSFLSFPMIFCHQVFQPQDKNKTKPNSEDQEKEMHSSSG